MTHVRLSLIALLLAGLGLAGCGKEDDNPFAGFHCYTYPPDYAHLVLDITINNDNRRVPVEIFQGDYDNNRRTILYDTVTTNRGYYEVPNGRVGMAVTYMHNNKRVIAIGSIRMTSMDNFDDDVPCDGCCYEPGYSKVNMRLKVRN